MVGETTNPLKTQLISHLLEERQEDDGNFRNRNPLDESEPFQALYCVPVFSLNGASILMSRRCEACRRGDVKAVQSLISFEKVNINAVDRFDYPPLTLVCSVSCLPSPARTSADGTVIRLVFADTTTL